MCFDRFQYAERLLVHKESCKKNITNSKQQTSSMCIQFCGRFWSNFESILALKINKNQLQIETDKAIQKQMRRNTRKNHRPSPSNTSCHTLIPLISDPEPSAGGRGEQPITNNQSPITNNQ